jgi:hypothetical protein
MLLDLVIDLFWPSREIKSLERLDKHLTAGTLPVEWRRPGAFKRALNPSGWLDDEVVAAGMVTQGKTQSLFRMITGLALLEVLRPRRSKTLPKEFVLAATADQVVALALSPWKEGIGDSVDVVKIKNEQRGSWRRGPARVTDVTVGRVQNGGELDLAGEGRVPFTWGGDDSTTELIELLSR